jgi:hypothetical protein
MRPLRTLRVATLLLVLLSSAACGEDTGTASDIRSETTTDAKLEPITARGVAAVVRDALGAERISAYSGSGEDDLVGATVRLGQGRDVVIVMVQTEGEAPVVDCDDLAATATGAHSCTVAEDGTILAAGTGEAFSDSNSRGSTVRAQSVNPETGRVVLAVYETYASRPALDAETLAEIVSDPDLAAMTDPSTNEAGADITMERAGG